MWGDEAAGAAVKVLGRRTRWDDEEGGRALSRAVKRAGERTLGRKPSVDGSVLRV